MAPPELRSLIQNWHFGLAAFAIVILAGCGAMSDGDFKVSKVSGTVKLDGVALAGAKVTFVPVTSDSNADAGPFSTGTTDSEGRFELTTRNGVAGAVIGNHNVEIEKENGDPEQEIQQEVTRRQDEAFQSNTDFSPEEEMKLIMELKKKYENSQGKFQGLQFVVPAEETNDANFDLSSE